MKHLFKNINFMKNEQADFLFCEALNPKPNTYTCSNVKFDNAMYFYRVWGQEQDTMEQFSEGLDDDYGTLSVFYYPENLVKDALNRIALIKEAILNNKMVSKNLTIEDIPKTNMFNIGFVPWISENTALVILTKKYKKGLFVVINNNDQNDGNEGVYFNFAPSIENFDENKLCYIGGEENTGSNSNFWLEEYPDFLKALNS